MQSSLIGLFACVILACLFSIAPTSAHADDVEGRIEALDVENRALVVQGITFFTTDATDYDDGLNGFEDLKVGQKVEVDFVYRNGNHYATEIELED